MDTKAPTEEIDREVLVEQVMDDVTRSGVVCPKERASYTRTWPKRYFMKPKAGNGDIDVGYSDEELEANPELVMEVVEDARDIDKEKGEGEVVGVSEGGCGGKEVVKRYEGFYEGLSEEEIDEWLDLVELGKGVLKKKQLTQVVNAERRRFLREGGVNNVTRKKSKKNAESNSARPSINVIKWFLARNTGLTPQQATEESGVSWIEVTKAIHTSDEIRCGREGLLVSSRQLVRELAYGVMMDTLSGGSVTKQAVNAAQWALERVDQTGEFVKANEIKEIDQDRKGPAGGGIVINLIGDAIRKASIPDAHSKAQVFSDI